MNTSQLTLRLQKFWQLLDCGISLILQHLLWVVCAPTFEAALLFTLRSMVHAPCGWVCTMNTDELVRLPGALIDPMVANSSRVWPTCFTVLPRLSGKWVFGCCASLPCPGCLTVAGAVSAS